MLESGWRDSFRAVFATRQGCLQPRFNMFIRVYMLLCTNYFPPEMIWKSLSLVHLCDLCPPPARQRIGQCFLQSSCPLRSIDKLSREKSEYIRSSSLPVRVSKGLRASESSLALWLASFMVQKGSAAITPHKCSLQSQKYRRCKSLEYIYTVTVAPYQTLTRMSHSESLTLIPILRCGIKVTCEFVGSLGLWLCRNSMKFPLGTYSNSRELARSDCQSLNAPQAKLECCADRILVWDPGAILCKTHSVYFRVLAHSFTWEQSV